MLSTAFGNMHLVEEVLVMKLDVLMSCMNQENDALVKKSCIVGNLVVINQCRRDGEWIIENASGRIRWIDSTTKGLSVSRNLAILASDADVCLLCDDDEVFDADYEQKILDAYSQLPDANVIALQKTSENCCIMEEKEWYKLNVVYNN